MTAYNPPLYSFSGLNFNPTIFETGTTPSNSGSSFASGIITDSIQPFFYSDPISLYTNSAGTLIQLGSSTTNLRTANITISDRSIDATSSVVPFSLGTSTSGNMDIGNSNNLYSVKINGALTAGSNSLYMQTNGTSGLIDGNSVPLYLGTNGTTSVALGTSSLSVNVGAYNFTGQNITSINPANNINIGSTQTGSLILGNSTNVNRIANIKFTTDAITSNSGNDIGIYQDATSTKGVYIGNQNNLNGIGGFLINNLGNGGSALPNIDTATVSKEMVIGSNNASQIWMGNTNANSQITTKGLLQVNNGVRIYQSNFYMSTPPQTFINKALRNETGGQFNSNLFGKNELDLVCYSGTSSSLSGLCIYSTDTSTSPTSSTATLVSSTIMNRGLYIFTGGLSYDKGNLTSLTSGSGYFTQTGLNTITVNLGAGATTSFSVSFTSSFGVIPIVTGSLYTAVLNVGAALVLSITGITTSGFTVNFYNSGPATGAGRVVGCSWTATGAY